MARSFNGSSDKIVCANNTFVNFQRTDTFSVFARVYMTGNANSDMYIVNTLSAGAGNPGWTLKKEASTVVPANTFSLFFVNNFTVNNILLYFNSAPSLNTWYAVGFTYTGSSLASGFTTYVNGSPTSPVVIQDNLSASTTNSIPLSIGAFANNSSSFWTGSICDVGIWNVVLTAGEVSAFAKGDRPYMIRQKSLVSSHPLDGIQSPEPDLSGNANNGTLTGTALSDGAPMTMFTPRWPNNQLPSSAPSATVFRRTASRIGTRTGTRQTWAA